MIISLRFTARSNVDLVRQSSQDSGHVGPHLYLLCDGMDEPAGGDIASAVAVKHLMPLDADSHQAGELLGLMRDAVQAAHTKLVTLFLQDPDLAGLGTICIDVMHSGSKLAMVRVDDPRVYVLRNDTFTQVTTGHTLVEYLVETGHLTRNRAHQHPQHSVLLRVLGNTEGEVQLDKPIHEAIPGDRWLLCSDGLSGPVIAETIDEVLAGVVDPGQAADQLIDLALRAGGPDNITAVVFGVVKDGPKPQAMPRMVGSAATERLTREHAVAAHRTGDKQTEAKNVEAASPAVKAAALMVTLENKPETASARRSSEVGEAITAEAVTQEKTRRHHRRRVLAGNLVPLTTLVGASALFCRWIQTHYYVSTYKGKVAIYRGTPQSIGPLKLSRSVKTYTGLPVEPLDCNIREHLEATATQPSMNAAETYVGKTVRSYRKQALAPQGITSPMAKPSSSSSSTPSPASAAPAQSAKPGQEG